MLNPVVFQDAEREKAMPNHLKTRRWAAACLPVALLMAWAGAQTLDVPNPSFESGADVPEGWKLSGGDGAWATDAADGRRAVSVTGSGQPGTSSYWYSPDLPFAPFTTYELRFHARRVDSDSGGCAISGPVFCNRDLSGLTQMWQPFSSIFVTPNRLTPGQHWIRFGQWELDGTVAYDNVSVVRAEPVHRRVNGVTLGEGESVSGNRYEFSAPLHGASANYARPLAYNGCFFNTYRLFFGADSTLVYRHMIDGFQQNEASIEVNIGYHVSGEMIIEAGVDGETWRELGVMSSVAAKTFSIPADMLPAESVWVRFRSRAAAQIGHQSDPGSFQIYGYTYRATLDKDAGELQGATQFVAVTQADPDIDVHIEDLGEAAPGGKNMLVARITPKEALAQLRPTVTVSSVDHAVQTVHTIHDTSASRVEVPYEITATGQNRLVFTLGDASPFRAEATMKVSVLYESGYGELLPGSGAEAGLWWCSSGWKVSRTRPLPKSASKAMHIQAARSETEAAQAVIRPARPLRGFLPITSDLSGPGGARIPADRIEVLRVHYVPVTRPTDYVGTVGHWPDPLPPFNGPINLEADHNQPLWVRIHVPRDAVAGRYTGAVRLQADGYAAEIPLEVEVFDFTLPDRMRCTTAFGFNAALAFRYHGVTDEAQRRAVYRSYLEALSAHHISPYTPAALDPFKVTWPSGDGWHGGQRDRTEKYSGESSLLLLDADPRENVSARSEGQNPLPKEGLRVRFQYKTQTAGHAFNLTLTHYDAMGQWIRGQNRDIAVTGDGAWQLFESTVDAFPESARHFSIVIWAAPWTEDGATMGGVWIDDVTIANAVTGEILIAGDFEPLREEHLTPTIDWSAWDAAMTEAMERLHFNSFAVPIVGMGGGTFHSRTEPSLLGYAEDTPEYHTAFTNYCHAVQEHLREKGWLPYSFVYWFDEPDPKDYEFVMNGFRKLKTAAPDIGRMLTEQVEEELIGGPNIWCPLTPEFDMKAAEERRIDGDRFWWYVCTGPKAPYVTLFIDHPGTEMRVWLWQTWQRRIDGILVWDTNFWTSDEAYPDPAHPQNPYEDPMGWTTGYSTPVGARIPWGNGDGRFLYPPEAAASGNPPQPVLDPPAGSIRLDMLRDGIEDYEYHAILERLLEQRTGKMSAMERAQYKALLDVPEEITAELIQFTIDPGPIMRRREAVARAIETLSRQ